MIRTEINAKGINPTSKLLIAYVYQRRKLEKAAVLF